MSYPLLVAVEVCPICSRTRRSFTCAPCLQKGDFVHSSSKSEKSFLDKKEQLKLLKERRQDLTRSLEEWNDRNQDVNAKRSRIILLTRKVETLKQAICLARDTQNREQHSLNTRKECYAKRSKALKNLRKQFEDLKEKCLSEQKKEDFTKAKSNIRMLKAELINQRKQNVGLLLHDIFPITTRPVYPEFGTPPRATISTQVSTVDVILERSMTAESELEEATMTSYVEGQWISRKETDETEYCIVETGLPTSGDYIRYFEWLKSHRNEAREPESGGNFHFNTTLSIPAALAYTAQLVQILSIILDVQLPRKLKYSEFCHTEISRRKFFETVSALNTNVMHLCYSQLVPADAISPLQVLKNVDMCTSSDNLGWSDAFETFPYTLPECPFDSDSSAEELVFDTDSVSDDGVKEEWDELPDLPDVPKNVSEGQKTLQDISSSEQSLSQSASGLVTSAAASVAAFWPWKKQK